MGPKDVEEVKTYSTGTPSMSRTVAEMPLSLPGRVHALLTPLSRQKVQPCRDRRLDNPSRPQREL